MRGALQKARLAQAGPFGAADPEAAGICGWESDDPRARESRSDRNRKSEAASSWLQFNKTSEAGPADPRFLDPEVGRPPTGRPNWFLTGTVAFRVLSAFCVLWSRARGGASAKNAFRRGALPPSRWRKDTKSRQNANGRGEVRTPRLRRAGSFAPLGRGTGPKPPRRAMDQGSYGHKIVGQKLRTANV